MIRPDHTVYVKQCNKNEIDTKHSLQILASEVISASYTEIQQIASELFLFFKDECQSGRKINCTVHTHSPMRGCSPWIFST